MPTRTTSRGRALSELGGGPGDRERNPLRIAAPSQPDGAASLVSVRQSRELPAFQDFRAGPQSGLANCFAALGSANRSFEALALMSGCALSSKTGSASDALLSYAVPSAARSRCSAKPAIQRRAWRAQHTFRIHGLCARLRTLTRYQFSQPRCFALALNSPRRTSVANCRSPAHCILCCALMQVRIASGHLTHSLLRICVVGKSHATLIACAAVDYLCKCRPGCGCARKTTRKTHLRFARM